MEPDSVSQLAQAIEEVVAGNVDYEALSRGARLRHAEAFSDATMAAGVADVYRDVLAEGGYKRLEGRSASKGIE